jgi:protein phosphatase
MESTETAKIAYYGSTDAGLVREDNQDTIQGSDPNDDLTATSGHLYAIADGMGGYEHGGIASALAVKTFFRTFYGGNPRQTLQNLRAGVRDANLSVYQAAQRMSVRMGTTLTGVSLNGPWLHIAHVGDSRAYLIRDGKSSCLTNDHTAVGDMVRAKLLTPDKIRTHNQRSILNRCLGMDLFIQPDVNRIALQQDDMLILCSDGIWSVVQDDEFAHVVAQASSVQSVSQDLLNLALNRESDDNVSVIVVHISALADDPAANESKRTRRFFSLFRNRIVNQMSGT